MELRKLEKGKCESGDELMKKGLSKSKNNETVSKKGTEKRKIIIDDDFAPLSQNLVGFLQLESP